MTKALRKQRVFGKVELFQHSMCVLWLWFSYQYLWRWHGQCEWISAPFDLFPLSFSFNNHTMWCKDQWCVSFPSSLSCQNTTGCFVWLFCLPVFKPGPDDGFIQLGDLPLQHWPQAFPQPVVILLQLLLVLFLVRCDEVLVFLNCLSTPTTEGRETRVLIWNCMRWLKSLIQSLTFIMQLPQTDEQWFDAN